MRRSSFRWIVPSVMLLAVGCAGVAYSQTSQTPVPPPGAAPMARERTIVVTGSGSVDATPDRAMIGLSVIVQRPAAQEAQQQNAATMAQVVRQIVAAGIPQTNIRTATVSLYPQRRPDSGGTGPIIGYQAVNRVVVTVDDISRAGQVIDAGVGAGANGVDGVEWTLRDASSYRTQALRLAVQNAQAAANAIASAAGVGGLRLLRIEQAGAVIAPRAVGVMQSTAVTAVLPGTMPVNAEVRAVYAF